MKGERKEIKAKIEAMGHLLRTIKWQREFMISYSSEEEVEKTEHYFEKIIKRLQDKLNNLPIGHKYTGVFFVRQPYSTPASSIKVEGSAFMPEDLISWSIKYEGEINGLQKRTYTYCRNIYRDKEMRITIMRDEGIAVFEKRTEFETA